MTESTPLTTESLSPRTESRVMDRLAQMMNENQASRPQENSPVEEEEEDSSSSAELTTPAEPFKSTTFKVVDKTEEILAAAAERTERKWKVDPKLKDKIRDMQKETFTKWMNHVLKERDQHIDELLEGCEDGLILISLIEILTGKKFPKHHKQNLERSQKMFNQNLIYTFLTYKNGYTKYDITVNPADIVDRKLDTVLEIVWTIFMKYQMKEQSFLEMLYWTKKYIKPAPANIMYFVGWADGTAMAMLCNGMKKDMVDEELMENGKPAEICQAAVNAAATAFAIPKFIDGEKYGEHPDERCLAMWLWQVQQYAIKNDVAPIKREIKILHKENAREFVLRLELEKHFAKHNIKEKWEASKDKPREYAVVGDGLTGEQRQILAEMERQEKLAKEKKEREAKEKEEKDAREKEEALAAQVIAEQLKKLIIQEGGEVPTANPPATDSVTSSPASSPVSSPATSAVSTPAASPATANVVSSAAEKVSVPVSNLALSPSASPVASTSSPVSAVLQSSSTSPPQASSSAAVKVPELLKETKNAIPVVKTESVEHKDEPAKVAPVVAQISPRAPITSEDKVEKASKPKSKDHESSHDKTKSSTSEHKHENGAARHKHSDSKKSDGHREQRRLNRSNSDPGTPPTRHRAATAEGESKDKSSSSSSKHPKRPVKKTRSMSQSDKTQGHDGEESKHDKKGFGHKVKTLFRTKKSKESNV